MTVKLRLVRVLLRLYPSRWRDEYGEELEALLCSEPLTASVIVDILLSAAHQHLRSDEPWKIGGLLLLLWSLFWIAWNSIAPLSPPGYLLFTRVEACILPLTYLAIGYWTTKRGRGVWPSASAAVKAAWTGILPELTLLALNAMGILPRILIDIDGHPHPHRAGIALLHTRGPTNGVLWGVSSEMIWIPIVLAIVANSLGLCGALAERAVFKLRARS
jgi:hypothetical protein